MTGMAVRQDMIGNKFDSLAESKLVDCLWLLLCSCFGTLIFPPWYQTKEVWHSVAVVLFASLQWTNAIRGHEICTIPMCSHADPGEKQPCSKNLPNGSKWRNWWWFAVFDDVFHFWPCGTTWEASNAFKCVKCQEKNLGRSLVGGFMGTTCY